MLKVKANLFNFSRQNGKVIKLFCRNTHNRNYESELIDYLLTGYHREARPVKDISKPVNVTIDLHIGKLIELVSRL